MNRNVDDLSCDGRRCLRVDTCGAFHFRIGLGEDALRFIQDMAKEFPKLNMLLYHNPVLHNVTLQVELFSEFVKIPQIVGMKDSHREPMTLIKLDQLCKGKISIMVNQLQIIPYKSLGAAGFLAAFCALRRWNITVIPPTAKSR